ncbi:MAG: hypothetical protein BWY15_01588 [Firmicutes bacterium ADurb.Bin193]|nr:MAG: hypothetical protein BWY15_01588 [Firmicutes bacterium ADurb.Bin193]
MENISLQIERLSPGCVAPGGNVVFESAVFSSGDIAYDSETGVITIGQPGRYVFDWWVATGCSCADEAVFALSGGAEKPVIGNLPQKIGQVSGFAVFDVDTPPASISLVNCSRRAVSYSRDVPVKASLLVTRHAQNTLDNLVDGNNTGAVRSIGARDDYTMGQYATALGINTTASGRYSHAEGDSTTASNWGAHAEGYLTTSSSSFTHAEGAYSIASRNSAHAEGWGTAASGLFSHAEGNNTTSSGTYSHAEGYRTTASGTASHAEGAYSKASDNYSHAEGHYTNTNQHVGAHIMGNYGDADTNYSWFLANGTDNSNRGLAAKILQDGNAYIDVAWNAGGADYAEMFETASGSPIEPGYFVTLDGGEKIRKATESDDYILGVSTAASGIVGNAGALRWKDKYLTDEWGVIRCHEVEIPEERGEDGEIIIPAHTETQPMLNPEWDPQREYVPRAKRPEWVCVGLLGKLLVRDDGTCVPGGYCMPNAQGVATAAESGYRVMKRTGENQVEIMFYLR